MTSQVMNSQKYHWLRIDGVYFEETEEMIANVMGLAMEGKSWRKHPRDMDEMSLWNFFCPNEGIFKSFLVYFKSFLEV